MKKFIFILTVFIFAVCESYSFAIGFGGFVNGGLGQTKWRIIKISSEKHIGFGGIFDTNVGKDSLFNYRFSFEVDKYTARIDRNGKDINYKIDVCFLENTLNPGVLEFYKYGFDNTFGFGLVRTEKSRFWMGPGIGMKYARINRTRAYLYQNIPTLLAPYACIIIPNHKSFKSIELNMGIALGLNINLTENFTLFLQTGARYDIMNGEGVEKIRQSYSDFGQGYDCYARAGVMFRFLESSGGSSPTDEKKAD